MPAPTNGRDLEGFPRVGDVVAGKYEIERILGVGGMGIVVAARHRQLDELVAIKLLHPDAAMDGEAVTRLLREARATISIKSEHVVRVHDVGTLDSGSPYILMEYLTGSDLAEVVRARGVLPVADAVDYVLQAGQAIAEAHARGIVHRDLKPSNLFLTRRPDDTPLIKVLDFGISKALAPGDASTSGTSAELSLTATRAVFGSPMYMSPEQVRSAKRVDERTDIWALGVILHELLTGASPFSGDTMPGVLASIAADEPEPLRRRRPDAPPGVEEAILRCLVKDVNQRTPGVLELAKALVPFASAEGAASLARIERLSMPGGVSRRALPARFSSTPPSHPSAPSALGSTVRATTAGTRGARRSPLVVALAVAILALVASVTWALRGTYDQRAPSASSSPAVAPSPPPPPAAAGASSPVAPGPTSAPPAPVASAGAGPLPPSSAVKPPAARAHAPARSPSAPGTPVQPAIDDPLLGR